MDKAQGGESLPCSSDQNLLSMLERFAGIIDSLLPEGESALLAVSGGMDSVLMCHLFHHSGLEFAVAHCNFQLRGEASAQDEAFVQALAERFHAPFFNTRFDTLGIQTLRGGSVQMVARDLRYEWLRDLALREGYPCIATAHHLNDSLETALYNWVKGTGIRGLRGILGVQGFQGHQVPSLIRPMLTFTKEEIRQTVEEWGLDYREDASNASDKYDRNKIRHHIVPLMQELNPSLEQTFAHSSAIMQEEEELLDFFMQQAISDLFTEKDGCPAIDKRKLSQYPATRTILFRILREYGFNGSQVADLVGAMKGIPGKMFYSKDFRLLNDRDFLLLDDKHEGNSGNPLVLTSVDEEGMTLAGIRFSKMAKPPSLSGEDSQFLDFDKLEFPLTMRRWQAGDYFYPLGMEHRKKLKKYFSDQKFSLFLKENTWILETNGEICALLGERIDERFKVDGETRHVLRIETPKKDPKANEPNRSNPNTLNDTFT